MFRVKEGKISSNGLFVMLIILLVAKIFLGVPQAMVEEGDSAAWLLIIVSALAAVPGIWVLLKLMKKFPGKNLIQIAEELLGRPGAFLTGLILSFFSLFMASVIVREFSETVLTTVLPQTPISIISFFFIGAMLLGAYNGLEVISRASTLLYPFILAGIFSILFLTSNYINFNNLFPIMGSGVGKILYHAPGRSSMYTEVIFAGLIAANIKDTDVIPRQVWKAFAVSVVIFVVVELFYVADLRVPAAQKLYVPLFQLARLIYMGRFIQRIESVYIFVWFFLGALKLTVFLYSSAVALGWAFKIPIYQPLLFPISLLIFALSFIPAGVYTAFQLDMSIIREYGAIIAWGLPLALLVAAAVRRKGGGQTENKMDK